MGQGVIPLGQMMPALRRLWKSGSLVGMAVQVFRGSSGLVRVGHRSHGPDLRESDADRGPQGIMHCLDPIKNPP